MNTATIPLVTSLISLIFFITVLDQYFAKRKPYQLIWAIGLFMYFISSGAEFWTEAFGINETAYRLWYLFGAISVAAYLGQGTIYLLLKRRTAHYIGFALFAVTLYAAVRVFTVDIDVSGLPSLTGTAMPQSIRLITPFLNTFGTVALGGGAIYSAWIFFRKRILPNRVVSNILIAVGAFLPAIGGSSLRLGGSLTAFYFLEMAGIAIIFVGFLRSGEVFGIYRFPLIHGFKQVKAN